MVGVDDPLPEQAGARYALAEPLVRRHECGMRGGEAGPPLRDDGLEFLDVLEERGTRRGQAEHPGERALAIVLPRRVACSLPLDDLGLPHLHGFCFAFLPPLLLGAAGLKGQKLSLVVLYIFRVLPLLGEEAHHLVEQGLVGIAFVEYRLVGAESERVFRGFDGAARRGPP